LAHFGTIHHQPEVLGFDVLAAGFQAMVHGGFQARLMAVGAGIDTGLHVIFGIHMASIGLIDDWVSGSMTALTQETATRRNAVA
jgi:hypothetical protein